MLIIHKPDRKALEERLILRPGTKQARWKAVRALLVALSGIVRREP